MIYHFWYTLMDMDLAIRCCYFFFLHLSWKFSDALVKATPPFVELCQVTKEVQQARTKAEEAKGEFEQDDGRMPCHGDSHYEKTLYIHRHIYVSYRAHKMRTADFKYDPHVFLLAESSSCSLQGNFWWYVLVNMPASWMDCEVGLIQGDQSDILHALSVYKADQGGAPNLAKSVYDWLTYHTYPGFIADISIVSGVFKTTYNWGAPHGMCRLASCSHAWAERRH